MSIILLRQHRLCKWVGPPSDTITSVNDPDCYAEHSLTNSAIIPALSTIPTYCTPVQVAPWDWTLVDLEYFIVSCTRHVVLHCSQSTGDKSCILFRRSIFITQLHTPTLGSVNVAAVSQVRTSAMFVLPIVGSKKLRILCTLNGITSTSNSIKIIPAIFEPKHAGRWTAKEKDTIGPFRVHFAYDVQGTHKYSLNTSKKTSPFLTKIRWLILRKEMIAVYSKNRTEHCANAFTGCWAGGTRDYHAKRVKGPPCTTVPHTLVPCNADLKDVKRDLSVINNVTLKALLICFISQKSNPKNENGNAKVWFA